MNVDPFDMETWPVLSEMRKDLRERIFDEGDPQKVFSLQSQLDDVEEMIKSGCTKYIPF